LLRAMVVVQGWDKWCMEWVWYHRLAARQNIFGSRACACNSDELQFLRGAHGVCAHVRRKKMCGWKSG
jgi:hypothetical protein